MSTLEASREKILLLEKELNIAFIEVLESVLTKIKGKVKLSVNVESEYDDNDYSTRVYCKLDGHSLEDISYALDDPQYADEDTLKVIQEFNQASVPFSEVKEMLDLLPNSFWENKLGFGEQDIDTKTMKNIKRA